MATSANSQKKKVTIYLIKLNYITVYEGEKLMSLVKI